VNHTSGGAGAGYFLSRNGGKEKPPICESRGPQINSRAAFPRTLCNTASQTLKICGAQPQPRTV
jgi:hypothetical protein